MTGTALVVKAEKTLVNINAARTALAKAVRFDEVKHIHDVATATIVYARLAQDEAMLLDAQEIKERAARKAGGKLIAMKESGERRPQGNTKDSYTGGPNRVIGKSKSDMTTLADLGITPVQSSEWQKLARQPEKEFEKAIAEARTPRKKKRKQKSRPASAARQWPDGDAPEPEFDRQVFLFNAREATELGKSVLADIGDAKFDDYRALETVAGEVIAVWQSVLTRLLKHKDRANG